VIHAHQDGSGVVLEAEHPRLPRKVAIKLLYKLENPDQLVDPAELVRREAQALCRVEHPDVVRIHDADVDPDGHPYIVMDYVDGGSLADRLKPNEPWPVQRAAALIRKILGGIAAIHAEHIVHRDIKPQNILMAGDNPRISDLGIAHIEGTQTLVAPGNFIGSPLYASPEQAWGEPADARSDLWSVGVLFYHLLCGAPPFDGNFLQLLEAIRSKTPEKPSERNRTGQIPAAIDNVVMKALQKDKNKRFQSAAQFLQELDLALAPFGAGGSGSGGGGGNSGTGAGSVGGGHGGPPHRSGLLGWLKWRLKQVLEWVETGYRLYILGTFLFFLVAAAAVHGVPGAQPLRKAITDFVEMFKPNDKSGPARKPPEQNDVRLPEREPDQPSLTMLREELEKKAKDLPSSLVVIDSADTSSRHLRLSGFGCTPEVSQLESEKEKLKNAGATIDDKINHVGMGTRSCQVSKILVDHVRMVRSRPSRSAYLPIFNDAASFRIGVSQGSVRGSAQFDHPVSIIIDYFNGSEFMHVPIGRVGHSDMRYEIELGPGGEFRTPPLPVAVGSDAFIVAIVTRYPPIIGGRPRPADLAERARSARSDYLDQLAGTLRAPLSSDVIQVSTLP